MMLVASTVNAKVKLAKVFSNDMVLQREKPVNVWGTADVFSGASCKTEIEAVQDNRTLPLVTLKDKTLIDFNPFGGPIRINTRK